MHAALDVGNIWKHLRAGEGCNPCPAHLEPPSCNPSGEERLRDETALPRQVRKARAHDGPGGGTGEGSSRGIETAFDPRRRRRTSHRVWASRSARVSSPCCSPESRVWCALVFAFSRNPSSLPRPGKRSAVINTPWPGPGEQSMVRTGRRRMFLFSPSSIARQIWWSQRCLIGPVRW